MAVGLLRPYVLTVIIAVGMVCVDGRVFDDAPFLFQASDQPRARCSALDHLVPEHQPMHLPNPGIDITVFPSYHTAVSRIANRSTVTFATFASPDRLGTWSYTRTVFVTFFIVSASASFWCCVPSSACDYVIRIIVMRCGCGMKSLWLVNQVVMVV